MNIKKIGILDFGIREQYYFNNNNYYDIVSEAILAESLGFSRVWYAEHFNSIYTGWMAADSIVSVVAAFTNTIKIGVAGTMIQYYQPLQMAANYKILSTMFPGRIDLGFAKGNVPEEYAELFKKFEVPNNLSGKQMINDNIKSVINLLTADYSDKYNNILLPPINGISPDLWNLTSTTHGYLQASDWGINCCLSLIHNSSDHIDNGLARLNEYRVTYFEKFGYYPQVNVAVAGTCQNNEKQAREVIDRVNRSHIYAFNDEKYIYGSPECVAEKLKGVAERFEIDEIIFLELGLTEGQRKISLKNISKIFSLS